MIARNLATQYGKIPAMTSIPEKPWHHISQLFAYISAAVLCIVVTTLLFVILPVPWDSAPSSEEGVNERIRELPLTLLQLPPVGLLSALIAITKPTPLAVTSLVGNVLLTVGWV